MNSGYFRSTEISFDVIFLFLNNLTLGFALGIIGLFIPIFLFERLNYSVQNVLIFFIVSGALFGFLVSSPKEAAKRILQLVKNPQLEKN